MVRVTREPAVRPTSPRRNPSISRGRAVAESEQLHRAAAERTTSCPFPEEKLNGRVGLAMSAGTYEQTTANAVASFDLYKQWPRNDFEADLFASINYDSSRDFNLTWPISQGFAVYRHRLDQRNFLFIDQLVAVNDSTFSTQDDDDDVSVQFSSARWLATAITSGKGQFRAHFRPCSSAWGHAMNMQKST